MNEVDQVDGVSGNFDGDRRAVVRHGVENVVYFQHRHMPVGPSRVGRELSDVDLWIGPTEDDHPGTKSKGGPKRMTDVDSIGRPVEGDAAEPTLGKRRLSLHVACQALFG